MEEPDQKKGPCTGLRADQDPSGTTGDLLEPAK